MTGPRNASELYEWMRANFGTGDFDDTSGQPYFRYVQREAGKINSICKRRRTSIEELYATAVYARAEGIPIRTVYDLLAVIPRAKRAQRRAARPDPGQALLSAAEDALRRGEGEWASKLYAAHPSRAEDVLREWEAAR